MNERANKQVDERKRKFTDNDENSHNSFYKNRLKTKKLNSVAFSPKANYTD
jgi:hypothetical protein